MPSTAIFSTRPGQPASAHDQVAAAAKNKERQIARAREGDRFLHFCDAFGLDEIPSRTTDPNGGEWGERNVFQELHELFSSYTRDTAKSIRSKSCLEIICFCFWENLLPSSLLVLVKDRRQPLGKGKKKKLDIFASVIVNYSSIQHARVVH